jgi:hypothetical protein
VQLHECVVCFGVGKRHTPHTTSYRYLCQCCMNLPESTLTPWEAQLVADTAQDVRKENLARARQQFKQQGQSLVVSWCAR